MHITITPNHKAQLEKLKSEWKVPYSETIRVALALLFSLQQEEVRRLIEQLEQKK